MQYGLIVKKLQDFRKLSQLRQSEMAEYLDMTQSEYSKIELGKTRLSYEVLNKLHKKGCDVDMLIVGVEENSVLPSLAKLYVESDSSKFISWLKLCEWAMEHWTKEEDKEGAIGSKLLKIFVSTDGSMTALEKLRQAYGGISQQEMADMIGVNIKKYRRLEKEEAKLDAELMLNIYEATKCRPSFFLDEDNYYLSVISEECRYDDKREEQLKDLLSMQEKFEENE